MKYPYFPNQWKQALKVFGQGAIIFAGIVFAVEMPLDAIAQTSQESFSPQIAQTPSSPVRPEGYPSPMTPPNTESGTLPQSVREAVLNDISNQTSFPLSTLTILSAEQRTWSDGCLGLPTPDRLCTQALVPGWQVIVSNNQQQWIYRTDETGSQVRLADPRSNESSPPNVMNGPANRTFAIASLPNGNYRFCSDDPPSDINRVSGACFRFRKAGQDIVGDYYYPYEGSSICLTGKVNGNTVTGQGLELLPLSASLPSNLPGENERTDWRQEGFLQVGRAERTNNYRNRRDAIRYRSAMLDLSSFYQYNAGAVLPPQQCF